MQTTCCRKIRKFNKKISNSRIRRAAASAAGRNSSQIGAFQFDRNLDKRKRSAAESLVFAKNQGQIAADGGVSDGQGSQNAGLYVFYDVRLGNKAHAYVNRNKTFEQLAGI